MVPNITQILIYPRLLFSQNFFRSQCETMRGYYDEMRSTYYAVRYFDELQELTWPDLGAVLSTLVLEVSGYRDTRNDSVLSTAHCGLCTCIFYVFRDFITCS